MTDREIMQQALEALEETRGGYSQNLIAALRERLAQPEQGPVAWTGVDFAVDCTPPQRNPWVGLTRAERFEIEKAMSQYYDYRHECKTVCLPEFAAAIEAKLKEKNNG